MQGERPSRAKATIQSRPLISRSYAASARAGLHPRRSFGHGGHEATCVGSSEAVGGSADRKRARLCSAAVGGSL
eukprot:9484742-Pyramimonas_sp.AAC.1